jgi:hypothetical protein
MVDKTALMADRFKVKAPELEGGDIATSAVTLLYDLNLLPTETDLNTAGVGAAAFKSPPTSVALIEAGGTALTKWWAAGGSALILVVWGAVRQFWSSGNSKDVHQQLIWGAAIVSVALVVGIAYLLSTDIQGRASAMAQTISARREIGAAFINAASKQASETSASQTAQILPIQGRTATNLDGEDSPGWHVIAMQPSTDASKVKYLLVKGDTTSWVASASVRFS